MSSRPWQGALQFRYAAKISRCAERSCGHTLCKCNIQILRPASQIISVIINATSSRVGLVVLTVKNSCLYRNHPFAASGGHAVSVAQRSECSSMNRSKVTAFDGHKNAVACKRSMSFLRHVSRALSPIESLHEMANAGKSGRLWGALFSLSLDHHPGCGCRECLTSCDSTDNDWTYIGTGHLWDWSPNE